MISWRTWELLPTPDIVLEKLKDIYVLDESVQNLAQGLNRDPSVLPDAIVVEQLPPAIPDDTDDEDASPVQQADVPNIASSDNSESSSESDSDSGSDSDSRSGTDSGSVSENDDNKLKQQFIDNTREDVAEVDECCVNPVAAAERRSTRVRRRPSRYAFHVSLKTALGKHGDAG